MRSKRKPGENLLLMSGKFVHSIDYSVVQNFFFLMFTPYKYLASCIGDWLRLRCESQE